MCIPEHQRLVIQTRDRGDTGEGPTEGGDCQSFVAFRWNILIFGSRAEQSTAQWPLESEPQMKGDQATVDSEPR